MNELSISILLITFVFLMLEGIIIVLVVKMADKCKEINNLWKPVRDKNEAMDRMAERIKKLENK